MRRTAPDRAPIAVRGIVLVAASVLLGTAVHAAMSGHAGLQFGPLLVTVTLVAVAVSAIVGTGAWLAAPPSRAPYASVVEDASAALGLTASQLLVHWLTQAGPSLEPAAAGLLGHHQGSAGAPVHAAVHTGHAGWGMALAHAAAALIVGLLLRWLESCALGLTAILRSAARLVSLLVAAFQPVLLLGLASPPRPPAARWGWRPPAALTALRASVVRRGPPTDLALV